MSNTKSSGTTIRGYAEDLALAWDRFSAKELMSVALGGSLSLKMQVTDATGHEREGLWIRDALSGDDRAAVLREDMLQPLLGMDNCSLDALSFELERARVSPTSGRATDAALYHAAAPWMAVAIVTHPSLLALGCVTDWQQSVKRALGADVLPIPFEEPGVPLARVISKSLQSKEPGVRAMYLRYRGLLVFAENLEQLQATAERYLQCASMMDTPAASSGTKSAEPRSPIRLRTAQIRKQISDRAGQPLLVRVDDGRQARQDMDDAQLMNLLQRGPASAIAAERLITPPVVVTQEGQPVGAVPTTGSHAGRSLVVVDPQLGVAVTANASADLERNLSLLRESLEIASRAVRLGTLEPLHLAVESGLERETIPVVDPKNHMFDGEVALVTGAASGIGRACAESLMARGAAVVGLDIDEAILHLAAGPQYLGMICDLTDEAALVAALEKCVRMFGGLDMLILNAGIFPPSCNLDALSLEHWQKVLRINLDVNVSMLREAFPLLKNAPRYGRVVINSSRNVPAPGPGAAAYSASKAALTQLGRVAALEWGKAHIRVNMINPHAVFDTGIWTDEVLKSRAAKYGISVQEYKTNNVLGVELTSHDVGELVAEMCGPLFSKITGAQIPMDGGSDRVI